MVECAFNKYNNKNIVSFLIDFVIYDTEAFIFLHFIFVFSYNIKFSSSKFIVMNYK